MRDSNAQPCNIAILVPKLSYSWLVSSARARSRVAMPADRCASRPLAASLLMWGFCACATKIPWRLQHCNIAKQRTHQQAHKQRAHNSVAECALPALRWQWWLLLVCLLKPSRAWGSQGPPRSAHFPRQLSSKSRTISWAAPPSRICTCFAGQLCSACRHATADAGGVLCSALPLLFGWTLTVDCGCFLCDAWHECMYCTLGFGAPGPARSATCRCSRARGFHLASRRDCPQSSQKHPKGKPRKMRTRHAAGSTNRRRRGTGGLPMQCQRARMFLQVVGVLSSVRPEACARSRVRIP